MADARRRRPNLRFGCAPPSSVGLEAYTRTVAGKRRWHRRVLCSLYVARPQTVGALGVKPEKLRKLNDSIHPPPSTRRCGAH